MATNTIKVALIGVDKGLKKTLAAAGKGAHTFGGVLKTLGNIMKWIGVVAIGALVAGIGLLIGFLHKAKKAYEEWMVNLSKTTRLTGMSAQAVSKLAVQFKMSGVDATKAQAGLALFSKALDGARRGVKANIEPFKRLHIALKDSDGDYRSIDDILPEVRNKLSKIDDAATRAGIAAKLFGRGFKEMLPWLMRSKDEIEKYTKWAEQLGLVFGKKSMDAFSKYRENQRKLSIGWDAIKINAYGALVPLINDLMPKIIKAMWGAADWVKRLRRLVEKDGWETALGRMVPGFTTVLETARKIYRWVKEKIPQAIQSATEWWQRNKQTVKDVANVVWGILKFVAKYGPRLAAVDAAFRRWMAPVNLVLSIVRYIRDAVGRVASAAGRVADALRNWSLAGLQAVLTLINNIAGAAQRAYGYLRSLLQAQSNNPNSGKGGGQQGGRHYATGGIATGPTSGYTATLHGTELIVPLGNKFAPAGGGGSTINVNVMVPGGTTLIGTAREVGEIIAPHVARALGREQARAGRRR